MPPDVIGLCGLVDECFLRTRSAERVDSDLRLGSLTKRHDVIQFTHFINKIKA
jgi:hypothetical protein